MINEVEVTKNRIEKSTQIVVVLDRSGSMDFIAQSIVDGFNSFIQEQKEIKDSAYLTLVQFDNEYEIVYKSKPIKEIKELILGQTFIPRATTALYDAIGTTIDQLDTTDDVIFVILTDGNDNSSKKFNLNDIRLKIEEKKKLGWNFLFIAANLDAVSIGTSMSINASNCVNYNVNSLSLKILFDKLSRKISKFRKSISKLRMYLNFSNDERKDIDK